MSPTHQDLSNDTTFSQIKSRVPVPLNSDFSKFIVDYVWTLPWASKHAFILPLISEIHKVQCGYPTATRKAKKIIVDFPQYNFEYICAIFLSSK